MNFQRASFVADIYFLFFNTDLCQLLDKLRIGHALALFRLQDINRFHAHPRFHGMIGHEFSCHHQSLNGVSA